MAYPTNTNKRVIYATQGVAVGDIGATSVIDSYPGLTAASGITGTGKVMIAHGLQSASVSSNFSLEAIFELGQLALYENYEEIPEIEVSFEKVLDGYSLMYHLGTVSSTNPTLTGRSQARADVRILIGYETETSIQAGGTNSGVAELYCSGMYMNSVSYNLSTDGNFTESTSLVGNNKLWLSGSDTGGLLANTSGSIANAFATDVFGNDTPQGVGNSVLRRQNLVVGSTGKTHGGTAFRTVVPSFIEGATTGATGIVGAGGTGLSTNCSYIPDGGGVYLNSVSVSCDFGRESINQLGKRAPYYRYVSFPVEVTCEIEVTATGGDNIDSYEEGQPTATATIAQGKNLSNHSIQFVLDDSTIIGLGNKNKVTSVSYGGGDATGGNAAVTYSMTNNNDLVVLHSGDPIGLSAANYFKNWFA